MLAIATARGSGEKVIVCVVSLPVPVRLGHGFAILLVAVLQLALALPLPAQEILLKGRVTDPQGNSLPHALVQLVRESRVLARATFEPDGRFRNESGFGRPVRQQG